MLATLPSEKQLTTLQKLLTKLAAKFGYSLLSPFADRHGVQQVRYVSTDQSTVKVVGIAWDGGNAPADWNCEFSAAVSDSDQTESRTVRTFRLSPSDIESTAGLKALQSAFSATVIKAAMLAQIVRYSSATEPIMVVESIRSNGIGSFRTRPPAGMAITNHAITPAGTVQGSVKLLKAAKPQAKAKVTAVRSR